MTADYIRGVGGLLQILGVAEVFREVHASQSRLFPGRRPALVRWGKQLADRTRGLLAKLGLRRSPVVLKADHEAGVGLNAELGLVVTRASEDDLPVEERLRRHRQRLDEHDQRISDLANDIRGEAAARSPTPGLNRMPHFGGDDISLWLP